MKFSLSWLMTHLDTDASLEQIIKVLNAIGLEVEAVEDRRLSLAPFRIARVVEAAPHPNADRLQVCLVDTGNAQASVVCGAPNARSGMVGVFAPPGAFIPGDGRTLKTGEIRGVPSAGMLVSARELGISDDHSEIIDLPPDAPVGASYAAWANLDDPLIEISVTPNRGDALSVRGVARDLAAAGVGILRPWSAPPVVTNGPSKIIWNNEYPEACPWILGRTVSGVRNGESPAWLKQRLTSVGLRPINALVDITNFFTVDLGRPLHAFDVNKLSGHTLTVRRGHLETFRGLHGKDIITSPDDCVIVDSVGVHSLAGIIGGEASGCDDTTSDVFIECALFDRTRIALTGQLVGVYSDARARFERGIDPSLLPAALDAATAMIQEICGGMASQVTAAGTEPAWQRTATLRFIRLADLGGAVISSDRSTEILNKLGFATVARNADHITVAVPPWRNDVAVVRSDYRFDPELYYRPVETGILDPAPELDEQTRRIAAEGAAAVAAEVDLIEEVLRIDGLDAITPVSLPDRPAVPQATLTPRQIRTVRVRRLLASKGLTECVTFSFLDHTTATRFGTAPESLSIRNPIASDLDQMRNTPLATIALAVARNVARGFADVALFEVGPGFSSPEPHGQALIAAGIRAGATPLSWIAPSRPVDLWDAKSDAMALLASLGIPIESIKITTDAPAHYHPGRSGMLRLGPKIVLGQFGALHPGTCSTLDLPTSTVAFEIFLDAITERKPRKRTPLRLAQFQPLRRDFAFILDETIPAETVIQAAKTAGRELISHVAIFDRYAGPSLPAGKVSLAIAVTVQPVESTLTEDDISHLSKKIIEAVCDATGATLRS